MTATSPIRTLLRRGAESVTSVLQVPILAVVLLLSVVSRRPAVKAAEWTDRRHAWGDSRGFPNPRPLQRPIAFLAVDFLLGLLSALIWGLIVLGGFSATGMAIGAATGGPVALLDAPPGAVTWQTVAWFAVPGIVLLFLALCGLAGTGWVSRQARVAFSRPAAGDLERQVDQLSTTLEDVVRAVDAERRRIERDIHDGVQQRVVALSLLLARVDRTDAGPDRDALQGQARDEVQQIVEGLREVAWRLYPAMLARDGLPAALEALCDRTVLPTSLDLPTHEGRVDLATETAAFFVASEAVSNVLKHAHATRIELRLARRDHELTIRVRDDGAGRADPHGPGLAGISSRVAARGGTMLVVSPEGGPTTVEARFPCA